MEHMPQSRLARKLLIVSVLSLLVVAVPGIWLVARLRAPASVRGGRAPASLATGAVKAPAPSPESTAGGESALPGDEGAETGDRSAAASSAGIEGTEMLSGLILTPEGVPIAGARVDARGPELDSTPAEPPQQDEDEAAKVIMAQRAVNGLADARGRFEIGGLAGGRYDLEVTARGFGRRNVPGAPTRPETDPEAALRIVLHPELFLRGDVVDGRAKPIAGAEVMLQFLATDSGDLDAGELDSMGAGEGPPARAGAAQRTRTDADGRFEFGGLGEGVYRAECSAAGYSPAVAPLVEVHESAADRETHLSFELDEGHHLRGLVRSVVGGPIAGARVRLLTPPSRRGIDGIAGREFRVLASGADGAFEFPNLPEETYELSLSASGHGDRTLSVTPGSEVIEIILEPRSPLEGLVVDRQSGEPVPDAEVRWQTVEGTPGDEESEPAERTDSAGRFRIDRFPEQGEALRIEADGYCTLYVDAAPPEDGSPWTLALVRGGTVSGRVRAARDLPVDGLRISLVRAQAWPIVPAEFEEQIARFRRVDATSSTDAAGNFRVAAPGAGTYRVEVDGSPYAAVTSDVVTVPDDLAQVKISDILLDLAATVQGTVFSRERGQVAGARVRVTPDRPADESRPTPDSPRAADADDAAARIPAIETRADATGAFTVGGLRPGNYRIVAGAPGFVTVRSDSFHLAAGSTHAIRLELEPEMTISGRVIDAERAAVPMSEIRAVPASESTGEHWREEKSMASTLGTFRVSRLAASSYDLRFSADGFASIVLRGVEAGRDDVEARLDRLVTLSGKVLGAYTSEPVVQFELRLRFEEEDRLSAREKRSLGESHSFSDPGGAFHIDGLPPGRYFVAADAPGHVGVEDLEIEVPVDHGLEDAEIRMFETGLITGVVVDGYGRAIAGARVEALQKQVDPDRGTVSFRPISLPRPPSEAAPRESPGGDGAGDGSSGSDGGGGDGGERRRRGRDGDRAPAAVLSKDDGTFVLRGLPDGVFRVSVTHDDFLARELGEIAFENGLSGHEQVALSILLPSGVVLRGRVKGTADIQAPGASVTLRPVAPDPDARTRRAWRGKSARVDDAGHFEIRGLEVGDYVLQARFRKVSDGSFVSIRRDVRIHGAGREQGILLDLSR